jgi:ATP-dependent DNA ligase
VAARGARPQLSGLFARAMRRQRVIGVPRTTLVRSCIINGEAVACGDDGLASFDRIRHRRYDDSVFMWALDLLEIDG